MSSSAMRGGETAPRVLCVPGLGLNDAAWQPATREKPGQVPLLLRSYARTGLGSMVRAMDEARRDDVLRTVATLRCPLLVIRGPHDRICPDDWARALVDAAPAGSTAVTLPRGSHMVPLTHGDLVACAVRRFLASVG